MVSATKKKPQAVDLWTGGVVAIKMLTWGMKIRSINSPVLSESQKRRGASYAEDTRNRRMLEGLRVDRSRWRIGIPVVQHLGLVSRGSPSESTLSSMTSGRSNTASCEQEGVGYCSR